MSSTPDIIPSEPAELRAFTVVLLAELKSRDMLIQKLRHQVAGQNIHRFGSKAEGLNQPQLRLEDEEVADAAASPIAPPKQVNEDAKTKRKPKPEHLPRVEQMLSAGDACTGCGGALRELGRNTTEELEYVPGRFVVNQIIRPRMACKDCECISQAPMPSRPIEKGISGPGFLAHVLVNKYADHLPLYRQAQIFAREDLDIDRSTLAGWVGKSAVLLEPLAEAIKRHVLSGQAIFADDTPVKMLAPGNGKTKTARFWAYDRDERPWGSDAPPAAWYQFTPDCKGIRPSEHLKDYQGWMHADDYAGFEELYRSGKIKEVACMAHVRRKFVDVFKSQGSHVAEQAIKRIAQLYGVEKEVRGLPPERRVKLRQAKATPILDDLESWLQSELPKLSGKTPLANALRYALTRMKRLRGYLDHGFLELDNNTAERSMRGIAIGRKNYMFIGSERGGKSAAIIYTSWKQPSSTTLTPKRSSQTSSAAPQTTGSTGLMNSCRGIIRREWTLTTEFTSRAILKWAEDNGKRCFSF